MHLFVGQAGNAGKRGGRGGGGGAGAGAAAAPAGAINDDAIVEGIDEAVAAAAKAKRRHRRPRRKRKREAAEAGTDYVALVDSMYKAEIAKAAGEQAELVLDLRAVIDDAMCLWQTAETSSLTLHVQRNKCTVTLVHIVCEYILEPTCASLFTS